MSSNLKSQPEGLKNAECEKVTPLVRLPIPYVPLTDLLEKREMEQIKVKLPNGTKFQMPTFNSGNNKEYLVYVIAALRLVEQKGTTAKVQEAYAVLITIRKEMSPFFTFPEYETATAKEARKKKLNKLNESLEAKKTFAVEVAQKAYKVFCCFVISKAQMQWTESSTKCTQRTPGLT